MPRSSHTFMVGPWTGGASLNSIWKPKVFINCIEIDICGSQLSEAPAVDGPTMKVCDDLGI